MDQNQLHARKTTDEKENYNRSTRSSTGEKEGTKRKCTISSFDKAKFRKLNAISTGSVNTSQTATRVNTENVDCLPTDPTDETVIADETTSAKAPARSFDWWIKKYAQWVRKKKRTAKLPVQCIGRYFWYV